MVSFGKDLLVFVDADCELLRFGLIVFVMGNFDEDDVDSFKDSVLSLLSGCGGLLLLDTLIVSSLLLVVVGSALI